MPLKRGGEIAMAANSWLPQHMCTNLTLPFGQGNNVLHHLAVNVVFFSYLRAEPKMDFM